MYLKFGSAAASNTSFTVILGPGAAFVDDNLGYTGALTAILSTGTGNAQITELT